MQVRLLVYHGIVDRDFNSINSIPVSVHPFAELGLLVC
jgi:hypothetical protein